MQLHKDSPVYFKPFDVDHDPGMFSILLADGTARVLAALMVWLAVLAVSQSETIAEEDYSHAGMVQMATSLLNIPAMLHLASRSSTIDSRISSIARQTQNSKVSAVTPFQWATILSSMKEVTLAAAMKKYKDRRMISHCLQYFLGHRTNHHKT